MEQLYINLKKHEYLQDLFPGKDLVSIDEILDKLVSIKEDNEQLEEQLKKKDEENDYNPEWEVPNIHELERW